MKTLATLVALIILCVAIIHGQSTGPTDPADSTTTVVLTESNTGTSSQSTSIPVTDNTTEPVTVSPNVSTTAPSPVITTVKPMTTTMPTEPTVGNWTVSKGGNFCIMAEMGIRLKIHYNTTDNKTSTVTVDVPVDADTQGSSCDDPQQLQLNFDKSWFVHFNFTKDKDHNVQVKDISVNYFTDPKKFPNATNPSKNVMAEIKNQKLFAAPKDQSYMCNAEETFKLQNLVEMTFVKLHIQAYLNTTKAEFGDIIECPADNKTNNIVPIAVGAALAALVVIVLIAYLISRNRNKRGYESV